MSDEHRYLTQGDIGTSGVATPPNGDESCVRCGWDFSQGGGWYVGRDRGGVPISICTVCAHLTPDPTASPTVADLAMATNLILSELRGASS